jgi:hypothetical protein
MADEASVLVRHRRACAGFDVVTGPQAQMLAFFGRDPR